MKFFGLRNFTNSRLMNEADADGGDNGGGADTGDTSLAIGDESSDFSSQNVMGEDDESVFKQFGLDASKYGLGEEETKTPGEESQGSDEDKAKAGLATDEKSFLNYVNSLGAKNGETPIKVESVDQIKNGIQMLHDYTQKTQALSEERKVFDSDKSEAEGIFEKSVNDFNQSVKAHETQLREFQQMSYALQDLQENAPDLFAEYQAAYSKAGKQFDNPVINQQMSALTRRLEEAEKQLASRENKVILDSFESEIGKMSATEQSWKELGITVDRAKVKERWAQTGLPVEEVVQSMYGSHVLKAMESKNKLATTQRKVAAKATGGAGASRPGNTLKAIDPKLRGLDFAIASLNRHQNI